jgi:hypothetical protein
MLKKLSFGILGFLILLVILASLPIAFDLFQPRYNPKEYAVIKDVTQSDFTLVQIDGQPVKRIKHGVIITYAPFALAKVGQRTLSLETKPLLWNEKTSVESLPKKWQLELNIEPFSSYNITKDSDGNPILERAINPSSI